MPKDGYAPAIGGTGVGPGPAVPFGRRERQPSSSGDTPTAAEGGSAAVRAAAYSGRGRRLTATVVSAVIPGVVQHTAGVASRMRSLLEEDLAVDHGVVDPLGQLPHPPAVGREVVDHVSRDR